MAEESSERTVSLADEDGVKQVLVESVLGLWDVVNNLTRLRPSKRDRYRVTIFGSARCQPDSPVYLEVKRVAAALAELGCDIITGGGPGLMQAANEGAASRGGSTTDPRSVGIRVELPFEQSVNEHVNEAYEHRTFFTRLHHFALASDCFVVAPGGIGTVLETLMIWQLLQVGHLQNVPLILVGKLWPGLVAWAETEMQKFDPPLAHAKDFRIPQCAATADDAIAIIRQHHATWQRMNAG
jgi:uncharacterized protein (TIGR00730 family)